MIPHLGFFSGFFLLLSIVFFIYHKAILKVSSKFFQQVKKDYGIWKKELLQVWSQLISDSKIFFSLLLLSMFGLAIRLYFLLQEVPMRYDEAYTFTHYISKPWFIVLSNASNVNNHMFHSILAKLAVEIFGSAEWVVRLPAFFFGSLLIPAVFFLGRRIFSLPTAIFGSALTAISFYLIDYSQNARGYSMYAFFTFASILLVFSLLQKANIFLLLLLVCVTTLHMYTVPSALIAISGIYLFYLISIFSIKEKSHRRKSFRYFLSAGFVSAIFTLILYSPALLTLGFDVFIKNKLYPPPASWELFRQFNFANVSDFFKILPSDGSPAYDPSIFSLAIYWGLFALFFIFSKKIKDAAQLLACFIFAICFITVVKFAAMPVVQASFLLPLLYLMMADAFIVVAKKISEQAVLYACMVFFLFAAAAMLRLPADHTVDFFEAKFIARDLKTYVTESDRLLSVLPIDAPLEYYAYQNSVPAAVFYVKQIPDVKNFYFVIHNRDYSKVSEMLELKELQEVWPEIPETKLQLLKTYRDARLYRYSTY